MFRRRRNYRRPTTRYGRGRYRSRSRYTHRRRVRRRVIGYRM